MEYTAKLIITTLQRHGYTAYMAGGAVRDMLLGIEAKDIDIATSATPDEIESLFEKTYPIAKQFGVIHVLQGGHTFEVATFRSDSGESDGRRPSYVTYTEPREDAMRRDFTINGMFYDPITKKLWDYVGGEADVAEGVIRFIGDPTNRIHEDHLRMLRAVRFAHQIKGQYEPETYSAIKQHAHLIQNVSWERIRDEVDKMLLLETRSTAMEDLQDLGLLQYILPEVERLKGVAQPKQYHREGSVWEHTMQGIASLGQHPSIELVWATLLHDIGKPDTFAVAERIRFDGHAARSRDISDVLLRRLKFPNKSREKILWAVEHHMSLFHILDNKTSLATKKKWLLHPFFPLLLQVHKADASGTTPVDLKCYHKLHEAYKLMHQEMSELPPRIISGNTLMQECGIPSGKLLGRILEEVYDLQLEGKITTKDEAIRYVSRTYPQG